jgi:outer membrane protein OmpA-like peptidoglycan-associated protein
MSNTGLAYDKSVYNTIGYLKISSDKKRLAVAINGEKTVQIFNFDNKTGLVSNPKTLKLGGTNNPYGLEFSPDSKLLYVGIVPNGQVFQANISFENEEDIQKSICLIGQNKSKKNIGALQLAINGKIYIAEYQSKFLLSIESPNTVGKDCYFKQDAVFLADNSCMFGLPTFFQDLVKPYKPTEKNSSFNGNSKPEINKKYTLENVYFDFNTATLRTESVSELRQLAEMLIKNPTLDITITGHTDSIGSLKYNKKLSISRAKAISVFLKQNKISTKRISIDGKGSSEPVTKNNDEAGRQKNRRVEFILKEQKKQQNTVSQ